ncbi:hypothetical protein [Lacinutrix sp.]|uniref:hypothetical protein n=1 Tax=Lacinutrix sp. TaxID=1937692 RepID=UPI0025C6A589|nr:hypothetical protein [Lacinutrix sp.]
MSVNHGKKILVAATNGSIALVTHCNNSYGKNRMKYSSTMTIPQGNAFELTYNGNINKWEITNTNP